MNESLAFYISTNTFRNPIFDADNINDSNQENSHKQNSTLNPNETNLMQCRNDDNYATRSQQPDAKNNNNKLFTGRRRLSNICDNFAFAIKCKAFVWELNLKRKLKDLRKFCDKNLPKVFHDQLFHQQHADRDSIHTHRKPNGRPRRKLDKYISSFWHEIEPDSPESLNKQQGRLLSRLEKAKRDSQKLFNMEKFENHYGDLDDQSYHGGQTRNNNGYNSGLNLFETRYVRPTEKQQSPSEMARVGSVLNTIRPAPRAAKFGAGLMESAASGWNNKVTGQSNDASNEKQSATMTMTTTPSRVSMFRNGMCEWARWDQRRSCVKRCATRSGQHYRMYESIGSRWLHDGREWQRQPVVGERPFAITMCAEAYAKRSARHCAKLTRRATIGANCVRLAI